MPDLLTTDEAATYLRLSERKLYELVANGAVPCTKVTGSWLFPKAALDRWLAAGLRDAGGAGPCAGAADRRRQPRSAAGMGAARERLAAREPAGRQRGRPAAARARRGHGGRDPSAPARRRRRDAPTPRRSRMRPACTTRCVIAFARREQGLLVAAGQSAAADATSPASPARRARLALRPQGAGAQLLLLALLARAGLALDALATRQAGLPDRARHRPGGPRRPRRLRHRDPRGGAGGRARFRAADLGALRPGAAPARLFPAGPAGAVRASCAPRHFATAAAS